MGALTLWAAVLILGCARSGQFFKDKDSYEDRGSDNSYYSLPAGGDSSPNGAIDRIAQPKKKVLILDFWNDTPIGDQRLGAFAAAELRRELDTRNRVILPETDKLVSVTKDFVDGDQVRVAQLVREGRRVGVSTVVIGRISKILYRSTREEVGILREAKSAVSVDVEMKVFDVIGGREVHDVKRKGFGNYSTMLAFEDEAARSPEAKSELAQSAVSDAISNLVGDTITAMEKMDWQGRIAKIVGNKVYINSGRLSGLLSGDILRVLSPGEEIIDPVTHAFLGRSEGHLKGTLEVSEFVGDDSSMTNVHTGGNFLEGDIVRLY